MKLMAILMLAASFAVAGCNTMSGFGKDVEKAGDKIDDAASKRK
jgi:predicted small secreted protein